MKMSFWSKRSYFWERVQFPKIPTSSDSEGVSSPTRDSIGPGPCRTRTEDPHLRKTAANRNNPVDNILGGDEGKSMLFHPIVLFFRGGPDVM